MATNKDNQRIAQNAFYLYIRMFITMIISLFTSRVVLNTLGETDYGIYNIVGGIVVLFSFLNAALTTATQRFFSYELGKKDLKSLQRIFSISMTCYIFLSLAILILSESIGLWFLNNYLNIPNNRIASANWVYQFSIIAFIFQMIRIPYHATIISYEKMNFFALISIIEVSLKLLIVYVLLILLIDKLILYSILMTVVILVITLSYKFYCNKYFTTTKYYFYWNRNRVKEFLSFSGWSLFGSIANITSQQVLNFLLNIYYGVTVNAAAGIANQVTANLYNFVANFQIAFNPQIVKSYAEENLNKMQELLFMSSRMSFYLIFTIGLPIIINLDYILKLWLGNVPQYTAEFISVIFIYQLIDAISMPFLTAIQARGKIKMYQIIISTMLILNIPLAYFVLSLGFGPYYIWFTKIIINIICFLYRCSYMKKYLQINILQFFKDVIIKSSLIIIIVLPTTIYIKERIEENFLSVSILTIFSIILCISLILIIGLKKSEKAYISNLIISKIKHAKQ